MRNGFGMAGLAAALALGVSGCATQTPETPQGPATHAATHAATHNAFYAALQDAAIPEPAEEDHDLVSLAAGAPGLVERQTAKGREVLMAMFTTAESVQKFYSAESGTLPPGKPVLWVTAVPQMQAACAEWSAGEARRQRLIRWLGLPPASKSDSVVEVWVAADRLLRPCSDPRTDISACSATAAAAETAPGVPDYRSFFAGLYVQSYSVNGAPWTRLGYTYDWDRHSATHRGASEFMVAPETGYTIAGRWPLEAYCTR